MKEKKPMVLVFGAQWSGDSAIMDQIMLRVSRETKAGILFFKVDIDSQQTISNLFHLQRVPTTLLLKDGGVVKSVNGFLPAQKIKELIAKTYFESFFNE